MKCITFILISTTLMIYMGCQKAVIIDVEKKAIEGVLDSYITSIENEDIELYSKILDHNPDMVNFGTAANERIVGWNALKKVIEEQNAVLSETKITQSDITVNVSDDGKLAYATSLWDFRTKMGEQVIQLPIRCSWILEKQGKDWKIIHFHKSVGTP